MAAMSPVGVACGRSYGAARRENAALWFFPHLKLRMTDIHMPTAVFVT
jgi:hypothetical protein